MYAKVTIDNVVFTGKEVGDEECGFRKDESFTVKLFAVRQILVKMMRRKRWLV